LFKRRKNNKVELAPTTTIRRIRRRRRKRRKRGEKRRGKNYNNL
jgi:hypothetical protein